MPDQVSHLCHTGLRKVARPAGLEPATLGLEGRCSIHLSYGRMSVNCSRPTLAAGVHENGNDAWSAGFR
jgi:hypothetical protein